MLLNGEEVEKILTNTDKGKASQVGYDLTLKGVELITEGGFIDLDKTFIGTYKPVDPVNDIWELAKGWYSIEFDQGCNMPNNLEARIVGRSSIFRCGGRIESGIYDPGFHTDNTHAFLQVLLPLRIRVGARVAQFQAREASIVASDKLYNGQWQGK